jgi:hypothetical protein
LQSLLFTAVAGLLVVMAMATVVCCGRDDTAAHSLSPVDGQVR